MIAIKSPWLMLQLLKIKQQCSVSDLVTLKYKIENQIPNYFVDVDRSKILQTLASYSYIFLWRDETIYLSDDFTFFEIADEFFKTEEQVKDWINKDILTDIIFTHVNCNAE